jgi:hypothetical protein
MNTVWVYVDTGKEVGDAEHLKVFASEALLDRMLNNIDGLCAERDRLKKQLPHPAMGKVLGGRRW